MTAKVLKRQGGLITAVTRHDKVLKVGGLHPQDETVSIVSLFDNGGVIWAVLSTGDSVNVNHIL